MLAGAILLMALGMLAGQFNTDSGIANLRKWNIYNNISMYIFIQSFVVTTKSSYEKYQKSEAGGLDSEKSNYFIITLDIHNIYTIEK